MSRNPHILQGNIPATLIKITIPSIVGMFGMMIFNIVDTYFVGRLGSIQLAAISFTFPVVMILNSLVFGIGTASMALFSRASGKQDMEEKRLLATSTMTLGITISILMGVVGYVSIKPLFSALGADGTLLPYISDYMKIWYLGAGFMVIPMLGDSILRGLGDTFTPAFVMMTVALVNLVLDPLMIFGIGPFPEMGIRGAALATIISRGIAALVSILIQIFREHLLVLSAMSLRRAWTSWKKLFHIGLPNSAVRAITPLGAALFTAILSRYGHEVVAGYGVATKIESIFLAVVNASTITTMVFVGQNLGADNYRRAVDGLKMIMAALFSIGLMAAAIFFFTGGSLAGVFNDDPTVRSTTALYLKIVPAGYGFLALIQIGAAVLNVNHKPYMAGSLSLFQIGVLAIPLSFVLTHILGSAGVFIALLASYAITGVLSLAVTRRIAAASTGGA